MSFLWIFYHIFQNLILNMNRGKEVIHLLILNEFKFGHNTIQTAININRAWERGGYFCDHRIRRWFQKFHRVHTNLENQESRNASLVKQSTNSTRK